MDTPSGLLICGCGVNNYPDVKKKKFPSCTRGVFYVRREVDLKKTAKVNAYVMHIFGKIEPLSIHAT